MADSATAKGRGRTPPRTTMMNARGGSGTFGDRAMSYINIFAPLRLATSRMKSGREMEPGRRHRHP